MSADLNTDNNFKRDTRMVTAQYSKNIQKTKWVNKSDRGIQI